MQIIIVDANVIVIHADSGEVITYLVNNEDKQIIYGPDFTSRASNGILLDVALEACDFECTSDGTASDPDLYTRSPIACDPNNQCQCSEECLPSYLKRIKGNNNNNKNDKFEMIANFVNWLILIYLWKSTNIVIEILCRLFASCLCL